MKPEKTKHLIELVKHGGRADDGYFQYAHIVACLLDKSTGEQLEQLVEGPTWDGDVISKRHRDYLLHVGLAIRVCCGGDQGYTGATYFAHTVLKAIKEIRQGKIAR